MKTSINNPFDSVCCDYLIGVDLAFSVNSIDDTICNIFMLCALTFYADY